MTAAWIASLSMIALCNADGPREKERAALLDQMRTLAKGTSVEFISGKEQPQLHDKPLIRYDDQPRGFVDATMWTWTKDGRPVALQKVEATLSIDTGKPRWGFCFTSLAEPTIRAEWKHGLKYQSREAGTKFQAVPKSPAVADKGAARKRQLRDIARAFSARILLNPRTNSTQELRLLTTPLYEYEDDARLPAGAVFGFACNGTNPDLVIVVEAREAGGTQLWHFAPARMTTGGLNVKYGDETVWTAEFSEPGVADYPTWTSFSMPRIVVDFE
jgi:hypothetical protein